MEIFQLYQPSITNSRPSLLTVSNRRLWKTKKHAGVIIITQSRLIPFIQNLFTLNTITNHRLRCQVSHLSLNKCSRNRYIQRDASSLSSAIARFIFYMWNCLEWWGDDSLNPSKEIEEEWIFFLSKKTSRWQQGKRAVAARPLLWKLVSRDVCDGDTDANFHDSSPSKQ